MSKNLLGSNSNPFMPTHVRTQTRITSAPTPAPPTHLSEDDELSGTVPSNDAHALASGRELQDV